MFGPTKRTPCSRAVRWSSACSSVSPVSAKPDGIMIAVPMPLSPTFAIVSTTNFAGIANTATSTSSGRSSMSA